MKGKMQRIIAMILVCCLMLSVDSFVAMAEEEGKVSFDTVAKQGGRISNELVNMAEDDDSSWPSESAENYEESLHNFDETKRITKNDVPVSIGYEEAKERGHRERRYDLEGNNLYKVVFDNDDDTRTEYYFDYPVKYTDKQGKVHDVKMELTRCDEGYRTAENSIVTTFSDKLEKGVILTDEEVNIRLVPEFVESSDAQIDTAGETVTYAIDDVTKIEYSLTYLGFKEDIVVSEYNGVTEYDFLLYTGGLKLQRIQEEWFLVDEAGVVHATVGDLIIFTADEKNNTLGEIYVETITRGELYRMTLVIDDEYLRSPDTKYPIRIDPTIEVNYDNDGAGAIEDVTINSGMGSLGTSGSIFIGKRTSGGIARTLMRFPGLDMSGIRSASQIQSATVEIRDLMCESTAMVVNCHVFTGNTWTEGTATWSNTSPNSYQSTVLSSNTVSYANGKKQATVHRYSFDITDAVIGWKLGNYNINKGILFKASSSTESSSSQLYKTFASYNRASYKPSLSITYNMTGGAYEGTYYLNNEETGRYLGNSGSSAYPTRGLLSNLGSKIKWAIHEVGDYYVIQPSTNSSLYLCSISTTSEDVSLRSITDGIIPTNCRWDIEYAGQYKTMIRNIGTNRYLIDTGEGLEASANTGVGTTAYHRNVWRTVTTNYYGNSTSYARRELTSTDAIFNNLTVDVNSKEISTNSTATKILWATPSDFTYTTSGEGATISGTTVTGCAGGGNVTVTATHKVTGLKKTFTVKAYNTAIIVIPGMMGSELEAGANHSLYSEGTDLWAASMKEDSTIVAIDKILSLRFTTNGTSYHDVVATKGGSGTDATYDSLMGALSKGFGERCEICFFSYDWRQSNADSAMQLEEFIEEHGFEKVVIVAHSMGGLVASSYLTIGASQRNRVCSLIMIGSPLLGTPIAPYVWGSENLEVINDKLVYPKFAVELLSMLLLQTDDPLNFIFSNYPSMYEMMPCEQYFSTKFANNSYLFVGGGLVSVQEISSFSETKKRLIEYLGQGNYLEKFDSDAEKFHDSLYDSDGEHITNSVNAYYIAGTNIETVDKVLFDFADWSVKEYTMYGDGIVPACSATLGDKYASRTFFVSNMKHTNLIWNTSVQAFIGDLIMGKTNGSYDSISADMN